METIIARNRMKNFELLLGNKHFSDVQLRIPNCSETIAAHRVILAASSTSLQELFLTKPKAVYTLNIDDLDALKMLLNFCYTGRIVLTAHNALPIIRAAAVLKMPDAMSICFEYITTQLNASNCVHYLDCSRNQKSFESFHKFVQKYAVEHFDEILEHESFNLLSAHDLSEFLRNDNLSIHSEENLFRALTKWHKKDPKNRQSAMKDMLPLIRYGDLSKKFIRETVKSTLEEFGCRNLLLDVLYWRLNVPSNSTPSFSTKSRGGAQKQSQPQLMAVVRGANGAELYGYDANFKTTG